MKKRVYIAESHHHVIREWYRHRGCGLHLLSFDYHTDFWEAFIRKARGPSANFTYSRERYNLYLGKHIPCNDVESAIKDLRYDEHIDFALKSGIIEKAFVFSHDGYTRCDARVLSVPTRRNQLVQAEIFSYCEVAHPLATPCPYTDATEAKMAEINTSDEVLNEVIKTFWEYGFNQDNYILDFDCDFIRDEAAMNHNRFQVLKNLIRGARAITIAREANCVEICSRQTLSYDVIEDWLVNLIKECCCDDVEIECEL